MIEYVAGVLIGFGVFVTGFLIGRWATNKTWELAMEYRRWRR